MKLLLALCLILSSASVHALVGLPRDTCAAIKQEAASMRGEASTAIPGGDTELSAQMECEAPVPYGSDAATLEKYWLKCADVMDRIYRENCDLP